MMRMKIKMMKDNDYKCLSCNGDLKATGKFAALYKCEKCGKEYTLTFNTKGYVVMLVFILLLSFLADFILYKLNITEHQLWIKLGFEFVIILILEFTGLWDKVYKNFGLYTIREYVKKS